MQEVLSRATCGDVAGRLKAGWGSSHFLHRAQSQASPSWCGNWFVPLTAPDWHLSFQSAAKMIKETMDKKFGSSWHVVIGEGFGFEITHEVKNLLYLYFGGTLAVCVWKCS